MNTYLKETLLYTGKKILSSESDALATNASDLWFVVMPHIYSAYENRCKIHFVKIMYGHTLYRVASNTDIFYIGRRSYSLINCFTCVRTYAVTYCDLEKVLGKVEVK